MPSTDQSGTERIVDQMRLLSALVDSVAGAEELREIYGHALDGLEQTLGISRSAVLLLDDEHVARFVAWRGLSDDYRKRAEGHFPWPVDTVDPPPIAVSDVTLDPSLAALQENFRSEGIGALAFVPLVYNRRLIGKFMLYHPTAHIFSVEELTLARTIGRLFAFALERTKVEHTLRDVDRRKDEFLATLAHELRNPLGALSAALEVMALRQGDSCERERAISQRQVQHLSRLLDDLLDLSRITRGLVELRKEPVELSTVVARTVEVLRPVLDRHHHQLQVSVPARRLIADPVRLEQILSNLLGNAAKYTPAGGRITIEGTSEPDQIVLRIRDTGIGMPAELIPRVFDLFTQGERSLDRTQGGLGIGLTISKQLVVRHGGTIAAFSEGLGKGSEFVVTLPTPREDVDLGSSDRTGEAPEAVAAPMSSASGLDDRLRVLLVDDNLDLASTLSTLIDSWGPVVETQSTGSEALVAVARAVPDVILLDIGMPEIDGYELARQFRAMPKLATTTLVAMSGYGQPADIERSYAAGFATHLVKPIDTKLLRRLLERQREEPRQELPSSALSPRR